MPVAPMQRFGTSKMLTAGWALALAAGVQLLGCASSTTCENRSPELPPLAPLVDSQSLGPALPDLRSSGSNYEQLPTQPLPNMQVPQARLITAWEVQCLASASSSMAGMMSSESRALDVTKSSESRRVTDLRKKLLCYAVEEERNLAARTALDVYYRLANTRAQRELLDQSHVVIRQSVEDTEKLIARGLSTNSDLQPLLRQSLDQDRQKRLLDLLIWQLQRELQTRLGMYDCACQFELVPQVDWHVHPWYVDTEAEVCWGLTHRPELCIPATLQAELDVETLPIAKELLRSTNGFMATAASLPLSTLKRLKIRVVGPSRKEQEDLDIRASQIFAYRRWRERLVGEEIRLYAGKLIVQTEQISIALRSLANWQKHRDQVEAKRAANQSTVFDLHTANLAVIKAQSELLQSVTDWKLALTQLNGAKGQLIFECRCQGAADASEPVADSAFSTTDQMLSSEPPIPEAAFDQGPLLGPGASYHVGQAGYIDLAERATPENPMQPRRTLAPMPTLGQPIAHERPQGPSAANVGRPSRGPQDVIVVPSGHGGF